MFPLTTGGGLYAAFTPEESLPRFTKPRSMLLWSAVNYLRSTFGAKLTGWIVGTSTVAAECSILPPWQRFSRFFPSEHINIEDGHTDKKQYGQVIGIGPGYMYHSIVAGFGDLLIYRQLQYHQGDKPT